MDGTCMLKKNGSIGLLVALALGASGCNSTGSTATVPTAPATTTDVLIGTVAAPITGVLQSSTSLFTAGQGGSVTVTLTSATETLPGGVLQLNVTMGMGIGSTTSGNPATCSLFAPVAPTQPGQSLSGNLNAGTYCVVVSDVTNQLGPVAYAVAVSHP
jgi:hypothetical protein